MSALLAGRRTWHIWLAVLCLAGCRAPGGAYDDRSLSSFAGVYRGSFDSALTEDPGDDLNHNPCDPANDDCRTHHEPLRDVLLDLHRDGRGGLRIDFYRDLDARRGGVPLDLLGAGCGTRLGRIGSASAAADDAEVVEVALYADNRLCLGKLRPTSDHRLRVALSRDADGTRSADVQIDKRVNDENYLYTTEDGVRRRVRIDLDNTITENHVSHYRVCIEDDLGEFDRCVLTDREFKSFVLPVPLPGGAALSYTWWQRLEPDLRRTSGRYSVTRYHGRFESDSP